MSIINYEELVAEYNDSLINVLRGFRPGYAFLEMWVPDADHAESILNLVDAAREAGELTVTLKLKSETVSSLDLANLSEELSQMGQVRIRNEGSGKIIVVEGLNDGSAKKPSRLALDNFNPLYVASLKEISQKVRHETTLEENDDMILIRSNFQGTSLFASVNPKLHTLDKVAFAAANSEVERALLEAFCLQIEGVPIQEASDHGLLKLEYVLRDKTKKPQISGIVNVFNFDPAFEFLQKLIRELLHIYREKTDFQLKRNFWVAPASKQWLALSPDEKSDKVRSHIEAFSKSKAMKDDQIKFLGIAKGVKVNIALVGEFRPAEKSKMLMELELSIRAGVERNLEVYQEEWKDLNSKRRL